MILPPTKYRPVTRRQLMDLAFVDRVVPFEGNPNCVTKAELSILLTSYARSDIERNLKRFRSLTNNEVEELCGKNAQHLLRQKYKLSDDKQTEIFAEMHLYKNNVYLVRGYKMIENPFWKLEVTKARLKNKEYLHPTNSMDESLSFMSEVLRGVPKGFVVDKFMHKKAFTLLKDYYADFSILKS